MAKICRMSPHAIVDFNFNPVVMREVLDLLLSGGELLPGPASLVSVMLQKVVDTPGGVEGFADFLNKLPFHAAPPIVPVVPPGPVAPIVPVAPPGPTA